MKSSCCQDDLSLLLVQPLLQGRLQPSHALEREVESLEVADRRLAIVDRDTHVSLRESKLDSPMFELLGKVRQLLRLLSKVDPGTAEMG